MSKQTQLFAIEQFTDWAQVYAEASETDRRIVDFVAAHPGCVRGDIRAGTGLTGDTLNFRLWELAGRGTGEHQADGLLIAERRGDGPYRYYARERP